MKNEIETARLEAEINRAQVEGILEDEKVMRDLIHTRKMAAETLRNEHAEALRIEKGLELAKTLNQTFVDAGFNGFVRDNSKWTSDRVGTWSITFLDHAGKSATESVELFETRTGGSNWGRSRMTGEFKMRCESHINKSRFGSTVKSALRVIAEVQTYIEGQTYRLNQKIETRKVAIGSRPKVVNLIHDAFGSLEDRSKVEYWSSYDEATKYGYQIIRKAEDLWFRVEIRTSALTVKFAVHAETMKTGSVSVEFIGEKTMETMSTVLTQIAESLKA